ncbi:MaoC family dehydratase [Roseobacter denitrificans]|uniref:Nodulation protein N-like protein n=1 Tax=Roseobacter denitrificans (strain ATCC 33942 / OCh 114) TaxID=375451 RepID=Q16BH3_ROSDO|nr:nodulation protein N-like protein [Roseobacter denitrificans OCh 114]
MMLTRETLPQAVGKPLGTSKWVQISQARIDAFADLTEDWQPIHLDPDAAQSAGFAGTVAHGFLTLSMLSAMSYDVLPRIKGESASINYGFDRVRFIAPVPAGARIRTHFDLVEAGPRGEGWMLRLAANVEIEGADKPALTADWLAYYLF